MSKERIKTLILTILILICLFFSAEIWFNEKLWSDDYNFFSVSMDKISSFFSGQKNSTDINVTGALDSLFSPRTAVLSFSDGRIPVNFTDSESGELKRAINLTVKDALSGTFKTVNERDYQSALTSKGIYADYSVLVSFSSLAEFLGTSSSLDMTSFDKIVIVTNNFSSSSTIPVYFANSETKEYIVAETVLSDKNILNIQNSYSLKPKRNISYAFELNLDKKLDDINSHQKVFFDSYVLLDMDNVNLNIIERDYVDVLSEDITRKILETFNVNPKTARKYVSDENNVMFVDSNCTITLNTDGLITYEASDEKKGFKISEDKLMSSCAAGSGKLIDDLLSCFPISENTRIFVNSPLNQDLKESYTFDFDYLFDSTPIYSKDHGATLTVKNGRLINLNTQIKSFNLVSEGKESNPLHIIDVIYQSAGERDIKINDLYFGYFDKDGQTTLSWQAKIEGTDDILIIN